MHAQVFVDRDGVALQDAGSSYGTYVDGRPAEGIVPLAAGMSIELGDCRLEVADRVDAAAAAYTVSVPVGTSLVLGTPSVRRARLRGHSARRPRLEPGWSLKRLDVSDAGPDGRRNVLKHHRSADFVRLGDAEAALLGLLDGEHDLVELLGEAGARCGADGPARLARLLAELADRGMLEGVDEDPGRTRRGSWMLRLLAPRERALPWVPAAISAVYRRGGWLLFTPAALALLAAVAAAGLVAFTMLVAGRSGTPFVVARRVGLGALVFVLGRFALVVCHELAHGLIAESYGRPVARAGIKVALVFPYVFVDTTDAWFESRRRRMAISLAGPASDLVLGGACALVAWLAASGGVRDVLFQVALGGYVGALFNLNPLMDRDGYHVLVDLLHAPGLRRRAARRLHDVLSGRGTPERGDRRLLTYAGASIVWSALTAAFAVVMSLRFYRRLEALAPPALVWTVLAAFYVVLALPLAAQLLRPLWTRVARPDSGLP